MSACIAGGSSTQSCAGVRRRFGSSVQIGNRPGSLSFPAKPAVCRAITSDVPAVRSPATAVRGAEKLDYWMRESVVEIVKSLGSGEAASAPLLVKVYGEDSSIRLRAERADAEDWGRIRGQWKSGKEASPEGIILVEELKDETVADDEGSLVKSEGQNGEGTKAWGVLLMGRGEEGGVASFLLKTTSGGSRGGCFSNCVHFSLVKVKSFQESARSQLSNCWLVQA